MLYNLKAGIIGLDPLGKRYADFLRTHIKDVALIGASGRTQKELLYAKNDLALQYVYSDYSQLIENHDIDAIFIFCPPDQKSFLASQAIDAGKHVFIGAPIATNVEDAELLFKKADSRPSQTTMAGFAWRLHPTMLTLKSMIDQGEIGQIKSVSIHSNFTSNLTSKYLQSAGSPFIDRIMDEIDLILWLTGAKAESIKTVFNDQSFKALCKLEKDILLDMSVSLLDETGDTVMAIYGSNGHIIMESQNTSQFKLRYQNAKETVQKIVDHDFPTNLDYLHLMHFTEVALNQKKSKLSLASNVEALKLAIAMEKSKVLDQEILMS